MEMLSWGGWLGDTEMTVRCCVSRTLAHFSKVGALAAADPEPVRWAGASGGQ